MTRGGTWKWNDKSIIEQVACMSRWKSQDESEWLIEEWEEPQEVRSAPVFSPLLLRRDTDSVLWYHSARQHLHQVTQCSLCAACVKPHAIEIAALYLNRWAELNLSSLLPPCKKPSIHSLLQSCMIIIWTADVVLWHHLAGWKYFIGPLAHFTKRKYR